MNTKISVAVQKIMNELAPVSRNKVRNVVGQYLNTF